MSTEVESLYHHVIEAWNSRDAQRIASAFADDGVMIGYDGSEMNGPWGIANSLAEIFADHKPGRWVALVREVVFPAPDLALLRAHAGWFMSSDAETFPQAVQTVVALSSEGRWSIVLLQTTPAAFHGRPDVAAQLADELRAAAAAES